MTNMRAVQRLNRDWQRRNYFMTLDNERRDWQLRALTAETKLKESEAELEITKRHLAEILECVDKLDAGNRILNRSKRALVETAAAATELAAQLKDK
jgi:hypothetical protein